MVMHMHNSDWKKILAEVRADIPSMAEEFIQKFRDSGSYGTSRIDEYELRETATAVLGILMDSLSGEATEEKVRQHADNLGRRRAQQEVAIGTLVDAIQLDFLVIWERIRRTAHANQEVLIAHVDELHNVVAKYNFFVRDGFRRENARLARDLRLANGRYIDKLFSSATISPLGAEEIALALGCAAQETFDVAVFHASSSLEARDALDTATAQGHVFGHAHHGLFAAFWPNKLHPAPELPDLPSVIFPKVKGLVGVRKAVLATPSLFEAAILAPRPTPVGELAWAIAGQALADFPGTRLKKLSTAITKLRAEQPLIVETVETYLRTGSVKATAEASFCHRNTVINRLHQFSVATDHVVTLPYDAAAIILALNTNIELREL